MPQKPVVVESFTTLQVVPISEEGGAALFRLSFKQETNTTAITKMII
jgi:hypothetical protein